MRPSPGFDDMQVVECDRYEGCLRRRRETRLPAGADYVRVLRIDHKVYRVRLRKTTDGEPEAAAEYARHHDPHSLAIAAATNACPTGTSFPASKILSKSQLQILTKRRYGNLSPKADAREAMLAVAHLGGLLRQKGDPGWIVLGAVLKT
jgi:hypothetical protein